MMPRPPTRLTALALSVVMMLGTGPAVAAREITIAGSEWCPYNCAPESPGGVGYMVEVAKAVFEPDHSVVYVILNWSRAVIGTQRGQFSALVGSSAREGLVFPAEPLGIAQNGFAVRRGDPFAYQGPESLLGRRLAVIGGYTYTDDIDRHVATNPDMVDRVTGDAALTNALRMLEAGRVDLVVDDVSVLRHQIALLGFTDMMGVVGGGPEDPVYLAFSATLPNAQALADRFDERLVALRASGRLATILARYGLGDWK